MNKQALGKRINEARKKQGITSERLSVLCEKTPVFIRQIESGARLPSLPLFVKICNALRISPDHLLREDLETNELDYLTNLSERIKELSPDQLEKLHSMIDIMFSPRDR